MSVSELPSNTGNSVPLWPQLKRKITYLSISKCSCFWDPLINLWSAHNSYLVLELFCLCPLKYEIWRKQREKNALLVPEHLWQQALDLDILGTCAAGTVNCSWLGCRSHWAAVGEGTAGVCQAGLILADGTLPSPPHCHFLCYICFSLLKRCVSMLDSIFISAL